MKKEFDDINDNVFQIENPKRNIILKGPTGYGLAINPDMKGHYVIIACGTGVLPFLDFFYFLLKKVTFEYFS